MYTYKNHRAFSWAFVTRNQGILELTLPAKPFCHSLDFAVLARDSAEPTLRESISWINTNSLETQA